jgi:hypothetical protein
MWDKFPFCYEDKLFADRAGSRLNRCIFCISIVAGAQAQYNPQMVFTIMASVPTNRSTRGRYVPGLWLSSDEGPEKGWGSEHQRGGWIGMGSGIRASFYSFLTTSLQVLPTVSFTSRLCPTNSDRVYPTFDQTVIRFLFLPIRVNERKWKEKRTYCRDSRGATLGFVSISWRVANEDGCTSTAPARPCV